VSEEGADREERTRSFWGWGWEDQLPDAEGRRNLAQMASAVLGFEGLEARDPPELESVVDALHAPRVEVPAELTDCCTSDPEARVRHTYGRSYRDLVRGFRGDFGAAPDVVASPRDESQIVDIFEWAERADLAVVPYGGGTSVVGGVEPDLEGFAGQVTVTMSEMDEVLEVDTTSRAARIQAGALGPQIDEALAGHGLTMRHYPQSYEFSTLGGWLATRSGGHYATVYTHIDDFVESMRLVTPRGTFETRRLPASGAGPCPDGLMLGSEGIFGIITEAWMRVQQRPRHRAKANVHFDTFEDGVRASRLLAQSGLNPANCRLLDRREAMLHQVSQAGTHLLLLGFESHDHPGEPMMRRALEIAESCGGRCPEGPSFREEGARVEDDSSGERWRQAFFSGPYLQSTCVSLGVIADTFETACTWDGFEELHRTIVEEVRGAMKRECGRAFLSCRFTHVYPDGPAPYYTFIAPARRGEELEQWAAIKEAASEALSKCGATITHHHAVGRVHQPWYLREVGPLLAEALRGARGAFDPEGRCNPGVLL
jgi:alkyldihydroxyacetonephosphate synthase